MRCIGSKRVQILNRAACFHFSRSKFAASRFDSDFEKGNALSARMFSAFCKRVVARFVSHCVDSTEDQNNLVQEQPHLVSSFDEAVDFAVRHGLPPFRFEHSNPAFEGSEQPLFAAGLLVSFQCHAVKDQRADSRGTPERPMVCISG
jgi:hypothetical protein